MALDAKDLKAISDLLDKKLSKIESRLDRIETRLEKIEIRLDSIEQWIPVANTHAAKGRQHARV